MKLIWKVSAPAGRYRSFWGFVVLIEELSQETAPSSTVPPFYWESAMFIFLSTWNQSFGLSGWSPNSVLCILNSCQRAQQQPHGKSSWIQILRKVKKGTLILFSWLRGMCLREMHGWSMVRIIQTGYLYKGAGVPYLNFLCMETGVQLYLISARVLPDGKSG